jgi:hypothetical protein
MFFATEFVSYTCTIDESVAKCIAYKGNVSRLYWLIRWEHCGWGGILKSNGMVIANMFCNAKLSDRK